ncbi:MAG TPA: HAD family phosphatase [Solirubrobacteraceae bacterium]|nr:HAD family phosphatase [Solirubrobacteraceae bacterium]
MAPPAAVIFDLDGVLVDSETVWNEARRALVQETGGSWRADAQRAMMGMSSLEWSRYIHEELGVPLSPHAISQAVVDRLQALYRERLPLLPGAREAVASLASRWPLALASSANRPVIALVLGLAGLESYFRATVSSEEVAHGKPAPDVYLEAARRISCEPARCAAVEDSANGLRAAASAGMKVIAIPNQHFPPPEHVLAKADVVLASIEALTPAVVNALDA